MPPRERTQLTYNYAEAADKIGCSAKTVSRMVASRQLKTITIGKARRIPVAELMRIAEGGKK